jgi:ribosomal protein L11 methyltransferase
MSSTEIKKLLLKEELEWMSFCPQFEIFPNWLIYSPFVKPKLKERTTALAILPSMTYGSGSNTLTRAALSCISELQSTLDPKEARVLDLGCGSGILALACAKLGFKYVDGMDISLEALSEARINAELNKLKVHFSDKIHPTRKYDFIIANLYGFLFYEYLPVFKKILKKDKYLFMGGIDQKQAETVIPLYEQAGFRQIKSVMFEGWHTIVWTR